MTAALEAINAAYGAAPGGGPFFCGAAPSMADLLVRDRHRCCWGCCRAARCCRYSEAWRPVASTCDHPASPPPRAHCCTAPRQPPQVWPWFARWVVITHYRGMALPEERLPALGRFVAAMRGRPAVAATQMPDAFYVEGYVSYATGTKKPA